LSYLGNTPTTQSFIAGTDYFNGNGSTTAFTLSRPVVSVNDIQAVVNNVVQVPNDAYNVSGSTITFTSAPSSGTGNVYVRYMSTTTQSITPSQNTVSYATWDNDLRSETFAFKNRIINGDMAINQRNTTVTPAGGEAYSVDRWAGNSTGSTRFSMQQSTTAPAGFNNSLLITTTTAGTPGASDFCYFTQHIEGFNTADLGFGTANAQTVTLSFWIRSSLTGSFGGSIANNAGNRRYMFSFTISAANTWEYKTITIAGDTTGTWFTDSNRGISVAFNLGTGASNEGTAGSWTTTGVAPTGSVDLVATAGATLNITGVQLEKGTTATNFDILPYGTELALCQRYYEQSTSATLDNEAIGTAYSTSDIRGQRVNFSVQKRAAPTMTATSPAYFDGSYIAATSMNAVNISLISFGTNITRSASFTTRSSYPIMYFWTASAEL